MLSKVINSNFAKRLRKSHKRGVTLIEIVAGLAIIGIVIAGGLIMYNNANTSRQTSTALQQLATIQTAVRNLYNGQPTYSGLSIQTLIDSEALPASMVSGTTVRHAFNGNITVAPATANAVTNSSFKVTFTNVPKDACKNMLVKDLGRGVYQAGTASKSDTQPNLPLNLTDADTACDAAYNSVFWTFL